MKTMVIYAAAISLLIGTISFGCTGGGPENAIPDPADGRKQGSVGEKAGASADKIKVVTTISVLADFIQQVGQDRVIVKSIVPAGSDPHTFQPTPQDVREVSESRIAFVNGMGLEGQIETLIKSTGKPDLRLVVLSEGLAALEEESEADHNGDEEGHSEGNPHLWLNVQTARLYVQRIQQELAAIDPAGVTIYDNNTRKYLAELADLDAWIVEQIGTIPKEKRKLVTFHDAFPYYAKRYGLDLVGVVLRSPGREPSAREVAELVNKIRSEGVRTVFAEPQFNARVLEVVAREARVEVATLYSDSIDDKAKTYSSMMRRNTEELVNGLR